MQFKCLKTSDNARLSLLWLKDEIELPAFMPVGTQGIVKALLPDTLIDIGYKLMLSNTYHLYLRPGVEIIEAFGGLHKFTNFKGSILTDSGGFQVFSLSDLRKVTQEGVVFKSHIDGSYHLFTPEKVLDIQFRFKSDIAMVLDECPAYSLDKSFVEKSLNITLNWAKRSSVIKRPPHTAVFGIVQGGVFEDLRKKSALEIAGMDFDGIAIGGLSVGESTQEMYDTVASVMQYLPKDKPRYAMGVGRPEDIVRLVGFGVDMFDCVMPTRNARNGYLFTDFGNINIKNAAYAKDESPIDENCDCYTCKNYSRAFLRHLYKSKELSFYTLATIHNLSYYYNLMQRIGQAIKNNSFAEFSKSFLDKRKYGYS
ncbi:tRNA guanosine(34) transglycosylase Tgt [Desulfurella multipotens]|uniref:tRNA guanosine(34) transglycosylase Tgt n=1 Tax=Desulfurella multipotens TaxID=79269 RepID=UPI000CBDAE92|nr:tRNA guanosine(34) transglycosylase Tgt [Desulfurella multipotens]PMP68176.1 MAG: tRNA guanosine(34) transglycosylase Tgt [Desulfurella multipotens]